MQQWLREVKDDVERHKKSSHIVALQSIEFHPGLSCPLLCNFCHTGRNTSSIYSLRTNTHEMLKQKEIESILDEFRARGGSRFVLSGGLEPFMSDIAVEVLSAASKFGLKINVYTSGLGKHLTLKTLPKVINYSDRIRFSISASTSTTYHVIQMPHVALEAATRSFARVQSLLGSATRIGKDNGTKIGVQFLLQKENIGEWASALKQAAQIGVDFFDLRLDIVPKRALPISVIQKVTKEVEAARRVYPYTKIEFRRSTLESTSPKNCHTWRAGLVIDAFGGVHVCCIMADQPANKGPFGLGFVRSKNEFAQLIDRLENNKMLIPQCKVCADRTRAFNAAIEDL